MNFTRDNILILLFSFCISAFMAGLLLFFRLLAKEDIPFFILICFGVIFFGFKILFAIYCEGKIGKFIDIVRSYRKKNEGETIRPSGKPAYLESELHRWGRESAEEAERLNRLESHRREYIGNVSHELKTPVFNIQGYIHTLLDGGLEDKNVNRDFLLRAEKNVDRMINIIRDLETVSQLEAGELTLNPEPFDMVVLVGEMVETEKFNAEAKGISITLNPSASGSAVVFADKFRIRQVMVNLIDNSIKYGRRGGETRIKISDIGDKIIIEVADNGIGIPQGHLPRIFERFYRVDKSRSREQGGTGLGLSIVKHILEAHRQDIKVMSTEGAGTAFSFTLAKPVNTGAP